MIIESEKGSAVKKHLPISLLVAHAAFIVSCRPMPNREFRFVSGKEYCQVVDLPPPYPRKDVPEQGNGVGSIRYYRRTGLPNSVFAVIPEPSRPRTYLPTSQLGWIIRFREKQVDTFKTVPSEWRAWGPPIETGQGDASRGDRWVLRTYREDDPARIDVDKLRSYPISGEFQSGFYSENNNYVEIVSDKVTKVTGRDTSGFTYFEIFRVRDRKLLMKFEYKRTVMDPTGAAADMHVNGYGYFHPIHDWVEKGVVCYFPPELFR